MSTVKELLLETSTEVLLKTRSLILPILEGDTSGIPCPDNGICKLLAGEVYNYRIERVFSLVTESWSKYSGISAYPVPATDEEFLEEPKRDGSSNQYLYGSPKWEGEQLKLRQELLGILLIHIHTELHGRGELGDSLPLGITFDKPAETEVPFKLNDKVRIAKTSEYYGENENYNPADIDGFIEEVYVGEDYAYQVKWETGKSNSYRKCDLVHVETEVTPVETEATPVETEVKTRAPRRQFDSAFKCTVVREIKRLRGTHGAMTAYRKSLDLSKQLVKYWEIQFDQGHFTENRAIAFSRKPVMIHG